MSRRFNIRRSGGGGGGGSGPSGSGTVILTPSQILGTDLVWNYDSRVGNISGTQWQETNFGNSVLLNSGSVGYGADGANFKGVNVWKAQTDTTMFGQQSIPRIAAGSPSFYFSVVFRQPNAGGTLFAPIVQVSTSAFDLAFEFSRTVGGATWEGSINNRAVSVTLGPTDTLVHRAEWFINAGVLTGTLDGVPTTNGTGLTITGDVTYLDISTAPGAIEENLAHMVVAAATTAPQRAQLRAYDTAIFGSS